MASKESPSFSYSLKNGSKAGNRNSGDVRNGHPVIFYPFISVFPCCADTFYVACALTRHVTECYSFTSIVCFSYLVLIVIWTTNYVRHRQSNLKFER
jgi:hypothetical protein